MHPARQTNPNPVSMPPDPQTTAYHHPRRPTAPRYQRKSPLPQGSTLPLFQTQSLVSFSSVLTFFQRSANRDASRFVARFWLCAKPVCPMFTSYATKPHSDLQHPIRHSGGSRRFSGRNVHPEGRSRIIAHHSNHSNPSSKSLKPFPILQILVQKIGATTRVAPTKPPCIPPWASRGRDGTPHVIPSVARNLPPFAKRKGARGMSCQPINAEKPNNHQPSFASFKHHGNHDSKSIPSGWTFRPLDSGFRRNDIRGRGS